MFGALDSHVLSHSHDEVFGAVHHEVALEAFSRASVGVSEDHGSDAEFGLLQGGLDLGGACPT